MTEREPTKSGVIGLIAAAIGIRRDEPIDHLLDIKFGVRIDQIGRVLIDYHTVHTENGDTLPISYRHYLADAVFLVGIEEDDSLLTTIDRAVKNPVFPLFLGRRSCPPAGPISLGVKQGFGLREALSNTEVAPWQASRWYQKKQSNKVYLEIVMDAEQGDSGTFLISDDPITFNQKHRKYSYRNVVSETNAVLVENPLGNV